MPSATGIVSELFGNDRDRAVGLFSSIFPIGGIIGPVLGGVFVTYWSWRGIFLVNIPVGITLICLGAVFIPDIARRPDQHLDIRGVGAARQRRCCRPCSASAIRRRARRSAQPVFLVPGARRRCVGGGLLPAFGRRESPFISLRFLTGRGFGVMNLLNFLYGCAVLGFAPLVPLYAQERFGLPALAAGTLLTARAVGMIATAGLAVYLLRRTGYRWPIISASRSRPWAWP